MIDTNRNYRYFLEPYSPTQKQICPQCGSRTFVRFIDSAGNPISPLVGKCDRENKCGYCYTPREFFQDNPEERTLPLEPVNMAVSSRPIDYIPFDYVKKSRSNKNSLVGYLMAIINPDTLKNACDRYMVGSTRDGSVIFWMIDKEGKVRDGKIMRYDPSSGHRVKHFDKAITSVKYILVQRGVLPKDFNRVSCLFGEHLLNTNSDCTVAVVESEKTALICSCVFPDLVWVATGGLSNTSTERLMALKGRNVVLFPDTDTKGECYSRWSLVANRMKFFCRTVRISDTLETNTTWEQKENQVDIADLILEDLRVNPWCYSITDPLVYLLSRYRDLENWIEDFGLVPL